MKSPFVQPLWRRVRPILLGAGFALTAALLTFGARFVAEDRRTVSASEAARRTGLLILEAWKQTVLTDGSGARSWSYIVDNAVETVRAAGICDEDVTWVTEQGFLPPYDALDDRVMVKLESHRDTALAPLFAWVQVGSGWRAWHEAGFSVEEAALALTLPTGHPGRPDAKTLAVLAALRTSPQ